jgi:FixJ family two-component response regulator
VTSKSSQTVAIIDDDTSILSALKDLMEAAGLSAQSFGSAEEFLESDQWRRTGCVVADIRMPGMSGLQLQAKLRAEGSHIPMIFITAHDDPAMRTQAMNAGAEGFLCKPFVQEVLLRKVRVTLNLEPRPLD